MTSACQIAPGTVYTAQPPPLIFVKRWDYIWTQMGDVCQDGGCEWARVARCSFTQGLMCLPAKPNWPRWQIDNSDSLPPDEYWQVSFAPQYACPALQTAPEGAPDLSNPCYGCGLTLTWVPTWTRIPTPRSYRWVQCPDAPSTYPVYPPAN